MLADDILNYLERITREFNPDELDFEAYAAISMAERFQVKRNTVSHYLNQAAEEGRNDRVRWEHEGSAAPD